MTLDPWLNLFDSWLKVFNLLLEMFKLRRTDPERARKVAPGFLERLRYARRLYRDSNGDSDYIMSQTRRYDTKRHIRTVNDLWNHVFSTEEERRRQFHHNAETKIAIERGNALPGPGYDTMPRVRSKAC